MDTNAPAGRLIVALDPRLWKHFREAAQVPVGNLLSGKRPLNREGDQWIFAGLNLLLPKAKGLSEPRAKLTNALRSHLCILVLSGSTPPQRSLCFAFANPTGVTACMEARQGPPYWEPKRIQERGIWISRDDIDGATKPSLEKVNGESCKSG